MFGKENTADLVEMPFPGEWVTSGNGCIQIQRPIANNPKQPFNRRIARMLISPSFLDPQVSFGGPPYPSFRLLPNTNLLMVALYKHVLLELLIEHKSLPFHDKCKPVCTVFFHKDEYVVVEDLFSESTVAREMEKEERRMIGKTKQWYDLYREYIEDALK